LGLEKDNIVTPTKYRQHLRESMKCNGKWCVDGDWKCRRGNSRDCYNVEHIIDKNGPEFKDYPECKNVPGNYIMAHGEWNQELGTLTKRHYSTSLAEKTRVYGSDIVNNAKNSIRSCINKHYGRNVRDDYQINFTEDVIVEIDEGIFIIPEGANVVCTDCDDVTSECDECACEECYIIPYVEEYTETTYSYVVVLCCVVGLTLTFVMGMVSGYCVTSYRQKKTVPREILIEEMIQ
jgi:hypothetical protein